MSIIPSRTKIKIKVIKSILLPAIFIIVSLLSIGSILGLISNVISQGNVIVNAAPPANAVTINQDFANIKNNLTSFEFGTNQFDYSLDTGNNQAYIDNLVYMKPGFLRVHYGGMLSDSTTDTKSWIKNGAWDRPKIKAWTLQMKNLQTKFSFEIMLNVPGFPSFINAATAQANPNLYGSFVAELVKIVNVEEGLKVKYLEITNELDDDNAAGGLNAVYNAAASKSKLMDPSIKTGGLAFQRPDIDANVHSFIDGALAAGTLDFVSYHAYAGPGGGTKNNYFYNDIDYTARYITENIKGYLATKNASNVLVFHNESNICYVYDCGDPSMTNQTGAVYDALGYILHLEAGGSGEMTWNEKDTYYGKMGNDYSLRPAAHVLHSLNIDRPSKIISTTKDNDSSNNIKQFSFISKSGKKGIFLVNRSTNSLPVHLNPTQAISSSVFHSVVNGSYTMVNKTAAQTLDFTIPAESVLTILIDNPVSTSLSLKVNLQAAYNTASGFMNTTLKTKNLIPLNQPYNNSTFNYSGTETTSLSNMPSNTVDWILMEFKNSTTGIIAARKAALLKADGTAVNSDGTGLTIPSSLVNGNYNLIVRHRNHLAISTNTPLNIVLGTPVNIDFRTNTNVKGSNQATLTPGVFGLKQGNTNGNNSINSLDRSIIRSSSDKNNVYNTVDISMDGIINSIDRIVSRNVIDGVESI